MRSLIAALAIALAAGAARAATGDDICREAGRRAAATYHLHMEFSWSAVFWGNRLCFFNGRPAQYRVVTRTRCTNLACAQPISVYDVRADRFLLKPR